MSKFDYKDPALDPEYCDGLKPVDDLDVPDFDVPEGSISIALDGSRIASAVVSSLASGIDPAEHAAHALIDALATLEQQIVLATSLEDSGDVVRRLAVLKKLTKRAFEHVDRVDQLCTAAIDRIQERRR